MSKEETTVIQMEDKIRNVLTKVARKGCKGTSDNINERVMIQGIRAIRDLFLEEILSLIKPFDGTGFEYTKIQAYNECISDLEDKLQW